MDPSEKSSPSFRVPGRFRQISKSSHVKDQSPPSPWISPATASHGRLSDDIRSIFTYTPVDQSYVADSGTSPILHRKPRKRPEAHTQISKTTTATRHHRLSLVSEPLTTGRAIHSSDFMSYEPGTSSQRQHRLRAQSVKKVDLKNAALPRAARRYSTHDSSVGDEVTSYHIMSPGTLATVTDTRYDSHARAPRNLHQNVIRAARRHATFSPPRMRAVVLSKTRASSLSPPPPIDDFPDIPPVELILFDPPKSVTPEVQRPHHSQGPLTSSPLEITQGVLKQKNMDKKVIYPVSPFPRPTTPQPAKSPAEVEEPPGTPEVPAATCRVTCLQMWVFCVAAGTTLSLPLGMVILSYLATPARDMSNLTSGPFSTTKSSGTAKTVVHTYQYPVPPTWSTVDPWQGVPASCQQIRHISDDVHLVQPLHSPALHQPSRPNIFCLYNNSRFHRGGFHDFLPENLPFSLCQNIVYWSFGVKDGVPTSRAENFDEVYGLAKLKFAAFNASARRVKILLAIGGYREDYAQLSLLGRDSGTRSRFGHHTMALLRSHFVDGVAIHWLEGEPICKSSTVDNVKALHAVFNSLRRIFRLNNHHGPLAVIVQTGTRDTNAIVESVVDVVNFVFMDNRQVWHKATLNYRICSSWNQDLLSTLSVYRQRYRGNEPKFCIVMSVAPLLVEASPWINASTPPQFLNISRSSRYGSTPGMGNAFDMCGTHGLCLVRSPPSTGLPCVIVRGSPAVHPLLLYVFNSALSLAKIFPMADGCVLLTDLDLDNYAKQCHANLDDYWFIRYTYGTLDAGPNMYLRLTMPYC
ncbi:hypothetical protein HPB49_012655 [Dermacentor silvarum]|uniref:Uncharacterized protein n=1 Tax=Dermacentor silvarum TaxID=543639 RepID=A0ACB8C9C4_DERSI|nr:hypothetical protein HPB49_012655 [Dermacentor silvarum]